MIEYEIDIPKGISPSPAQMDRGSLLCEKLHEQIVELYSISQCAKALGISLSTTHNTVKSFRELGGSLCIRGKDENQH